MAEQPNALGRSTWGRISACNVQHCSMFERIFSELFYWLMINFVPFSDDEILTCSRKSGEPDQILKYYLHVDHVAHVLCNPWGQSRNLVMLLEICTKKFRRRKGVMTEIDWGGLCGWISITFGINLWQWTYTLLVRCYSWSWFSPFVLVSDIEIIYSNFKETLH